MRLSLGWATLTAIGVFSGLASTPWQSRAPHFLVRFDLGRDEQWKKGERGKGKGESYLEGFKQWLLRTGRDWFALAETWRSLVSGVPI